MECPQCSNIMEDGAVVCDVCGTSFETLEFDKIKHTNANDGRVAILKRPQRRKNNNPPQISLPQYLYMLLVMCVPILGIIMAFLWAFKVDEHHNPNRTNLARAMLIVWLVLLVIFAVLSIFMGGLIGEFMKNYFSMF
jgi:hypothetical protein